jgi:allantoicase
MISDSDPVWKNDDFTPFGKWMDGWETRRRRTEGNDWCIVQLGLPGVIKAIEVSSTVYFMLYNFKLMHCLLSSRWILLFLLEITLPK